MTTATELHPVLAAMQSIVDDTPDTGEGGAFHHRSDFAWVVIDDYKRAEREDPDLLDEFEDSIDSFEAVKAACLRDAAKAVARWLDEDA